MNDEDLFDSLQERKSKTAIKREFLALQDLARELLDLPTKYLQDLPLSSNIEEAVRFGKDLKQGALARQIKYIGGLLAHEDSESIKDAFQQLKLLNRKQTDLFHQIEQWRDRLIAGDKQVLEELIHRFETLDRQHLNQLVRNANKEMQQKKPPKSSRALFRYLSQLSST